MVCSDRYSVIATWEALPEPVSMRHSGLKSKLHGRRSPKYPWAGVRADAETRLHSSQLQTYLNLNLNSESIDSLDDVKP